MKTSLAMSFEPVASLIIGALVIGLTPAVAVPATAAATNFGSGVFCYYFTQDGRIVRYLCRPLKIELVRQWPIPPDGCLSCGPMFMWREDPRCPTASRTASAGNRVRPGRAR
ncbi:MAG: hypothetical protein HC844_15690 [Tabrizicola sp.]|nr:hypothetical protein [Tabrizicola sp.]